jgi:hypothetical protein
MKSIEFLFKNFMYRVNYFLVEISKEKKFDPKI